MDSEDSEVVAAAEALGKRAGELMKQLQDRGIDVTPLPGETFVGALLRLQAEYPYEPHCHNPVR